MELLGKYFDLKDYLEAVYKYILDSKKSIIISSYLLDFDFCFMEDGLKLSELLIKKVHEGIYLRINLSEHFSSQIPDKLKDNVIIIRPEKTLPFKRDVTVGILKAFENRSYIFHQKFIFVDQIYLFFGGAYFMNYYLLPNFKFSDTVLLYRIVENDQKDYLLSQCNKLANYPFINENDHLKYIYEFIDNAEEYIYLHNQYIVSDDKTSNQIFKKIKERLFSNRKLKCLILINRTNHDEPNLIIKKVMPLVYLHSAYYLLEDPILRDQIRVCYLDSDDRYFIHDKLYLVDDKAIITSANLFDRSFESDMELGVVDTHNGRQIREDFCGHISNGKFTTIPQIFDHIGETELQVLNYNRIYHLFTIFLYKAFSCDILFR